jgi:hypothetical protein
MHQESGIHFKFLFAAEAAEILVASGRFFVVDPCRSLKSEKESCQAWDLSAKRRKLRQKLNLLWEVVA